MTDELKPLTEDERQTLLFTAIDAQREVSQTVYNILWDAGVAQKYLELYSEAPWNVQRLAAEVRRLRREAACEACADGLRLGAPGMGPDGSGPGVMHYHGEDKGGATWGVCRKAVAATEHDEVRRLRAEREKARALSVRLEDCGHRNPGCCMGHAFRDLFAVVDDE